VKTKIYPKITETKNGEEVSITEALERIRNGFYQDIWLKAVNDKNKKILPYFTPSGLFEERRNAALLEHSNLICIDLDDLNENVNSFFDVLIEDKYVYSIFRSVSHKGLAVLVKIEGEKHSDAFDGLSKYFFDSYALIIDPSCKDVSRPRFITYDPSLYINEDSKVFKEYVKQEPKKLFQERKSFSTIHYQTKFENVLAEIENKGIDITGDYLQWLRIGFAIGSEFGTSGLHYFQRVSRFSGQYDTKACEKQYRYCCSNRQGITIATFYYYAKHAGIEISNKREQELCRLAYYGKTGGRSIETLETSIQKITGAPLQEDEKKILKLVYEDKGYKLNTKEVGIEEIEDWLSFNYNIRRNLITLEYELEGKPIEDIDINEIFITGKKLFENLSMQLLQSLIFRSSIDSYNPIKDYLNKIVWDETGKSRLEQVVDSIPSETASRELRFKLIERWALGMVRQIYEDIPNQLCLVLTGKQRTGKTEFFRRLFPKQLRRYLANSKLDEGKDSEILMCQKLLIVDDEYSGKSKQDFKKMKDYLGRDKFTVRPPYGRCSVTMRRLATLAGTCNEIEILNDPTGNRRILVIEVVDELDFETLDKIDRDQLWAELVWRYKEGFSCELSSLELKELEETVNDKYQEASYEAQKLQQLFYSFETYNDWDFKTATEIKDSIEVTCKEKISLRKLGMELKKLKYKRVFRKSVGYGYLIKRKESSWN